MHVDFSVARWGACALEIGQVVPFNLSYLSNHQVTAIGIHYGKGKDGEPINNQKDINGPYLAKKTLYNPGDFSMSDSMIGGVQK